MEEKIKIPENIFEDLFKKAFIFNFNNEKVIVKLYGKDDFCYGVFSSTNFELRTSIIKSYKIIGNSIILEFYNDKIIKLDFISEFKYEIILGKKVFN